MAVGGWEKKKKKKKEKKNQQKTSSDTRKPEKNKRLVPHSNCAENSSSLSAGIGNIWSECQLIEGDQSHCINQMNQKVAQIGQANVAPSFSPRSEPHEPGQRMILPLCGGREGSKHSEQEQVKVVDGGIVGEVDHLQAVPLFRHIRNTAQPIHPNQKFGCGFQIRLLALHNCQVAMIILVSQFDHICQISVSNPKREASVLSECESIRSRLMRRVHLVKLLFLMVLVTSSNQSLRTLVIPFSLSLVSSSASFSSAATVKTGEAPLRTQSPQRRRECRAGSGGGWRRVGLVQTKHEIVVCQRHHHHAQAPRS